MKKTRFLTSNFFLWMVLICSFLQAYNQTGPDHGASTSEYTVRSSSNGKVYRLHVSLPKNYNATDSLHYPVLYVLDGKYSFNTFHSTRSIMNMGSEIKDIIIVAIDNTCKDQTEWLIKRHYDLTPSSDPKFDAQLEPIFQVPVGQLKSGGAALFLVTLEKDIIPFVNGNFRTSKDQGISGHSLGALFATYSLLQKPSLFKRYGINSPSFWWNNNEMSLLLNDGKSDCSDLKGEVFFSIGALEGDMMVAPYRIFLQALEEKKPTSLKITSQIFENETHLSVVPASSSRTLRTLYGL